GEVIAAAGSGAGTLLMIEAPAGLGKTRLAEAAVELAGDRGLLVLRGRGGELERNFRYGVVRQLFEPAVTALGAVERAAVMAGAAGLAGPAIGVAQPDIEGPVTDQTALHGLYWLTSNLSAERPLLLVVDDAHWADRASLEWLVYLTRRIGDLPVALVVCSRPNEPGAEEDLLVQLASEPAGRLI